MHDSRVYVFRIDNWNQSDFVRDEMRQGRLRQGWGPAPLAPAGSTGYAPDSYVAELLAAWPGEDRSAALARYNILYPMLEMRPGSLIVIPKFPELYGRSFAIAQFTEPYRFEATEHGDHGHCIAVEAATIKTFEHDSSLDAKCVSGKLTGYQRAINNAWNEEFIQAVRNLWARPGPEASSTAADWVADLQQRTLGHIRAALSRLPPHAIEQLAARAFEDAGYSIVQRNYFDGQGGDADLVLSLRLPMLSDIQGERLKLFVQTKKREGEDYNDTYGLEQLNRIAADEPMALKVLLTTAPRLSDEAEAIAQEKASY